MNVRCRHYCNMHSCAGREYHALESSVYLTTIHVNWLPHNPMGTHEPKDKRGLMELRNPIYSGFFE